MMMKKRISKILIANRGEIACRIIRSARKLGIRTVAVYSEVDHNSENVLKSDEAYCIGKASSQESYLNQQKLMTIIKRTNCDAVHPGYGFLSENAEFSEYCLKNNVVFIGPPASAIRDMGIKSTSKKIMSDAGVPVIPGYHGDNQSDTFLKAEATHIGFPLMIKAIYGGGGKGMRIVFNEDDFLSQLESARRESINAFGNDSVLLEKYITAPRHVEVQVFADKCGNCVHLNERDCSIQRRHQKVIEEAPAPSINQSLRQEIGSAAVRAAKAVNYVGAGTVEFIYEPITKNFYFMEMNTRLQVEHPVTEMITKTDLVEWQIKIAAGEELPLKQNEIPLNGHSVEARIYAEDPYNGFLPGAGPLIYFDTPQNSSDTRFETGVRQGDEVSVYYDPLIAKLVVWGENRREAFSKLHSRLLDCHIVGLNTNVEFLTKLAANEKLLHGEVNTAFIDENKDELLRRTKPTAETIVQAVLGLILWEEEKQILEVQASNNKYDPFTYERGFRVNSLYKRSLKLIGRDKKEYNSNVIYQKSNSFMVNIDGMGSFSVNGYLQTENRIKTLICHFNDVMTKCNMFVEGETLVHVFTLDGTFQFEVWSPKFEESTIGSAAEKAVAPMPGIVSNVLVKPGTKVTAGDPVVVLIAMKMEHVIKSPKIGVIKNVLFEIGQSVPKNAAVIEFEDE